jgi:hypothetical protein
MNDNYKLRRKKLAFTVLKNENFFLNNDNIDDDSWISLKMNLMMSCLNFKIQETNLSSEEMICIKNYLIKNINPY